MSEGPTIPHFGNDLKYKTKTERCRERLEKELEELDDRD